MTRVTTRQFTYLQTCATCPQPNLSGTDNWKIRNENGRLKPPPLDSAGHVWRHSDSLLIEVVTDGSFDPDSNMKGFTDWLSDSEIADVIEFLRSTWGPEDGSFQWSSTWQASQQWRFGSATHAGSHGKLAERHDHATPLSACNLYPSFTRTLREP